MFVPCTQPSNVLSLESEGASSGNAAVSRLFYVRLNLAIDGGGESEVDVPPAEYSEPSGGDNLVAGEGRPLRSDPQLQLAYHPGSIRYPFEFPSRVAKIVKVSPLGIDFVQSDTGVSPPPPSPDVLLFR